jgi:hypothetical protein
LIERGTGVDLHTFAKSALFEPLGISASEWTRGDDGVASAASGAFEGQQGCCPASGCLGKIGFRHRTAIALAGQAPKSDHAWQAPDDETAQNAVKPGRMTRGCGSFSLWFRREAILAILLSLSP